MVSATRYPEVSMIRSRADVAVYAPDNSLLIEVEVKTKLDASPEWAARLLRNMVFHEAAPSAPYFMLALPDAIYLWDLRSYPDARLLESGIQPDYEIDATRALGPYLGSGPYSLLEIGEDSLTLVVASWLTDLANSGFPEKEHESEARRWLLDSGLHDSIKGGSVATEVLVP